MRTKTMVIAGSLLLASSPIFAANVVPPAPLAPQTQPADPAKTSVVNAMVGKKVMGKSREYLGDVASVDADKRVIEMKAPTGAVVPIPLEQVTVEGDHLRANISRGDVLALIRQTGQSGVFEVDAPAASVVK